MKADSVLSLSTEVPSYNSLGWMLEALGVDRSSPERLIESLPFSLNDTTAGSETELQAIVIGNQQSVDLPLTIRQSTYYSNVAKRAAAGETSKKTLTGLENFLNSNTENVWNNSWVRFPRRLLSRLGNRVLEYDLLYDKKAPSAGLRGDSTKFLFTQNGEGFLRVPLSYLLKLALADALGTGKQPPLEIFQTWTGYLDHFLNDNTSPETHSFYIAPLWPSNGGGKAIAKETSERFLLTQLLVMYSNEKFGLKKSGQRAVVFHSPHPPVQQKKLNELISDSFYRELFMNPCLSGWDRGEEKHDYMHVCHEVLSRSQLNTIGKLRESGIISHNLVVLPNTSNISLANNGIHLSLGSLKITEALKNKSSGFSEINEKYLGDLTIKFTEHFLPLFVGTYSAAPYRMDFRDFHPERALGFLPHELHYTHLRMIWRRWQKKARLKIMNKPITPFGPSWLDETIDAVFGLQGDYIPDFRLIDYLVCLLSTESSPALDGRLGNDDRLKKDLMHMGVFDKRMSLYLLYKLRRESVMGFSGYEGRHYSLFESLMGDMAPAANLQVLVTLLAYKYMANGEIDHDHIPDNPFCESERRQIIFGAALGIPTFFVRKDSGNLFLQKVLKKVKKLRPSGRYPGYLRVYNNEYQKALFALLQEDAADLIELLNLKETMHDLKSRLEFPQDYSAFGKITKGILNVSGKSSPFKLRGFEFNSVAEKFYRDDLRLKHLKESFEVFQQNFSEKESLFQHLPPNKKQFLASILGDQDINSFLESVKSGLLTESLNEETLRTLIYLLLLTFDCGIEKTKNMISGRR